MAHRVDDVPWFWRPLWLAYSWIAGAGLWLLFCLLGLTCRWREKGQEGLRDRSGVIYCLWHRTWFLWAASPWSRRRQAWLQHPAAYMKPVHLALRLAGIGVLLGSGGEEGRAAAHRLAQLLQEGWSTSISPDGPHGPVGVLREGVLRMALESGAPVVPVRLAASWAVPLPSWDRKLLPLPFSRITVEYGEPVHVTVACYREAGQALAARMGKQR